MKLLHVLIVSFLTISVSPLASGADQHPKWEYKVFYYQAAMMEALRKEGLSGRADDKVRDAINSKLEEMLNQLGAEGWELCLVAEASLILKRPKAK